MIDARVVKVILFFPFLNPKTLAIEFNTTFVCLAMLKSIDDCKERLLVIHTMR